jgi:hypothetical protein
LGDAESEIMQLMGKQKKDQEKMNELMNRGDVYKLKCKEKDVEYNDIKNEFEAIKD